MNTNGEARGAVRLLIWMLLVMLVMGGLPVTDGAPRALAQDGGTVIDIGEPPVAGGVSLASGDSGSIELAATPLSVDLTSRSAARTFYNSHFIHTLPPLNWTGNFDSCVAGTTSAAYKQAMLDQLAWYRVMAGVSGTLALSTEWSAKAQQAALMMGKASSLSHFPGPTWPCFTAGGAEAAANSNIAYAFMDIGLPPVDFITMYMQDAGASNAPVGHRRWFLSPQLSTVGIGSVPQSGFLYSSGNAVWVLDGTSQNTRPATRDGFVAWPPAGYVPYQVVFPRWSFSYPGAVFNNATVSVTRNGASVSTTIEDRTSVGYGENTIVFNVGGSPWAQPSSDQVYRVTINNVMIGGVSQSFTYDVVIFDPAVSSSGSLPKVTLNPNTGSPGDTVNYAISGFPASSQVSISWKRSSSNSIALGTVTTSSSGSASGSFQVPSVPGGGYPVVFTSGSTSRQAIFAIAPRVQLLTPTATFADTVGLQISGFGANQSFYVTWTDPEDGTNYLVANNLTMDANGQASVTLSVPWWTQPGPQEIRVVGQNPTVVVKIPGPFILTNPPTAVAAGQTAYSTTTLLTGVALDGSGSTGADGAEISSWIWRLNGNQIATGEITSAMLPLGVHDIELTVTDEFGLTDTAILTVTISVAPQSAVANAGPDLSVPSSGGNGIVNLNGSASVAAPGTTITAYTWTRAGVATPIATGVSPTVSLPIGTYDITLTVTTNFNTTSTDVVNVVVGAPPTANAGPDQSIDTYANTATVNLNGSGSTAGAGSTITGYQWTGLPGGTLSGATPSVSLPVGSHTATLTVTASNGMTATDTVAITIVKLAAPTVSITPKRAAPVAKIDYTISNFPRGSTVAITWTTNQGVTTSLGNVSLGASNTATGQISVPAGPGGLGNFLTFSLGSVSVSAEVDVAPRISPSVTSVSPGQAITVNLRGFAPRDDVLLRWKVGNGWVNLGSTRTSSTGSVTNFPITVPLNADTGIIRVQGTLSQQSSAVTLIAPTVSIAPERTTVNNAVSYAISQFPPNSTVQITWVRLTGSTIDMGTAQTDANGNATGHIVVPATPGGPGQQIIFASGSVSKTVLFEVAPRVKVTPAPAARGQEINISLRGFARGEAIRIRWRLTNTSTWIVLATGQTSNTGSANIVLLVPAYAADGMYQLRAETASFNQQTNTVEIQGGGQVVPAAEVVITPEPAPEVTAPVEIDRTALPLDAPVEIMAITDEAQTPGLHRLLTDNELATGWNGTPDPFRGDARLTVDLGAPHTLRGFAWLTATGGCGELTGLEYSLDGETWTAFDPFLQPGPIGEGMVWRYQAATNEARFIRFAFAPETPEQATVGCLAELAVWGTAIVTEEAPVEKPVSTDVPAESPVETPTPETTPEPAVETPAPVEPEPADTTGD